MQRGKQRSLFAVPLMQPPDSQAAAAIRLANDTGLTSVLAGETTPVVVNKVNGASEWDVADSGTTMAGALSAVASGLDLVNAISDENYMGAGGYALNLLRDVGKFTNLGSTVSGGAEAMSGLGIASGLLGSASAIQGLTSDDALTQIKSAGNLVTSLYGTYQGASNLMNLGTNAAADAGNAAGGAVTEIGTELAATTTGTTMQYVTKTYYYAQAA